MMKENTKISKVFLDVIKNEVSVDILINEIKENKIAENDKYAYQAFCCAFLAKRAKRFLQKGEYIKQYGNYISKSFHLTPNSYLSVLIRNMVETKLENVKFKSHVQEDLEFLRSNLNSQKDLNLCKATLIHFQDDE